MRVLHSHGRDGRAGKHAQVGASLHIGLDASPAAAVGSSHDEHTRWHRLELSMTCHSRRRRMEQGTLHDGRKRLQERDELGLGARVHHNSIDGPALLHQRLHRALKK